MGVSQPLPDSHAYLTDVDDGREMEAVRRLVQLGPLFAPVLNSLGLHHEAFWCVLEFDCNRLAVGIETDIDILIGPLAWADPVVPYAISTVASHSYPGYWEHRFAAEGKLQWPPPTGHLAGIETKVACVSFATTTDDGRVRASHSGSGKQRRLEGKLRSLLQLGLDRVLLLDVLVGPPATATDPPSGAWLSALSRAGRAKTLMRETLRERRVPASVGHAVWSIGSVEGGLEHVRGAGGPELARLPQGRPSGADCGSSDERRALVRCLNEALSYLDPPRTFPIVLVDCRDCRRIHYVGQGCGETSARRA